jgi:hypothetical protein
LADTREKSLGVAGVLLGDGEVVRHDEHLLVQELHRRPALVAHLVVAAQVAFVKANFGTGFSLRLKGQAQEGSQPGGFELWVNWIQLARSPHLGVHLPHVVLEVADDVVALHHAVRQAGGGA